MLGLSSKMSSIFEELFHVFFIIAFNATEFLFNRFLEEGNFLFFGLKIRMFLINSSISIGTDWDRVIKQVLNFLNQFHLFIKDQHFKLILRFKLSLTPFILHWILWLFFHFSTINSSKKQSFSHVFNSLIFFYGFFFICYFLESNIGIAFTH